MFHAIIDRLQDTPKPAIPKNPLSAIIVKPDMTQVKYPLKKPDSAAQSPGSSPSRTSSPEAALRSKGSLSPTQQEAQDLVTTLSRLGVTEGSGSLNKSIEDINKRRRHHSNKVNDHSQEENGQNSPDGSLVERTYREGGRKRDSFCAMEEGGAEREKRIEWRFWRWSFKDVDKCKTMIITSRILILFIVTIFNILYWSIALGSH